MPARLMSYIKDGEFWNLRREIQHECDAKTGDISIFQTKENCSPNKSFLLPLCPLQLFFRSRHFVAAWRQNWGRAPQKKQIAQHAKWSGPQVVIFVSAAPSLFEQWIAAFQVSNSFRHRCQLLATASSQVTLPKRSRSALAVHCEQDVLSAGRNQGCHCSAQKPHAVFCSWHQSKDGDIPAH